MDTIAQNRIRYETDNEKATSEKRTLRQQRDESLGKDDLEKAGIEELV